MATAVNIKVEARYVSHNVTANKAINVVFKMPYTELSSYIRSIQMLNENVTAGARISSDKPIKLGSFMIKSLHIDGDGEGKLVLNSLLDSVNLKSINTLAERNDEPLSIILKATIEDDGSEDDEEDSEDEE